MHGESVDKKEDRNGTAKVGRPQTSTPEKRREYKRKWAARKRRSMKGDGKRSVRVEVSPVVEARLKAAMPKLGLAQAILFILERLDFQPSPPAVAAAKVGRNHPCPCGSGQKAKRCCHR